MAATIRLARFGAKKKPTYRIVVADSRASRDGKFIERIGTYNPNQDPPVIRIEEERALKWLSQGARLSDTVRNLMRESGLLKKVIKGKSA